MSTPQAKKNTVSGRYKGYFALQSEHRGENTVSGRYKRYFTLQNVRAAGRFFRFRGTTKDTLTYKMSAPQAKKSEFVIELTLPNQTSRSPIFML